MLIQPIVMEETPVMVPLARISTNEGAQTRAKLREAVVRQYAAAMTRQRDEGRWRFPPVQLFHDGKDAYWIGDGFHRVRAALQAGFADIQAQVRRGTERDAVLFGLSANQTHGLPRSNADKRQAVVRVLADAEWAQWSDREIARRCQVDHAFVSKLRRSASGDGHQIATRKVKRGGTVYEMEVLDRSGTDQTAPAPSPDAAKGALSELEDLQEACALVERLDKILDGIAAAALSGLEDLLESRALVERLGKILDRIPKAARLNT